MKILFCIAAVLAIREINAAATGAVVRVDQRNTACPALNGGGDSATDEMIDGKVGCYKLYCNGTNGWQANETTHCNCCVVHNDPHIITVGNSSHRVGTGSWKYEFMEKCAWNLWMKHQGPVTDDNMNPLGSAQSSLFATFFPCDWAEHWTCIRDCTLTLKQGMNRLQFNFELLDSSQTVMINQMLGNGAPDTTESTDLSTIAKIYKAGVTIALLYEFKTQSDLISCVRCIFHRGMLVVCPNLVIFFYRPISDPMPTNKNLFGMCGMWTDLLDDGHTSFQDPITEDVLGTPNNHSEYMWWMMDYYSDDQPVNCDFHNVTLYTERRDSAMYIVASEETCQGYKNHVDACTKTVNKHGRELPESQRQDSIGACVTDMCGVTRGARNDEELQKGLNKWLKVAAEVTGVRSIAG